MGRPYQIKRGGVTTAMPSVLLPYRHTPSEVLCLEDVQACIDLVCAYCQKVMPDTDSPCA